MSAASIPVVLEEAVRNGKTKEGYHLVLVGFGGVSTWGATVLKWSTQKRNNHFVLWEEI